MGTTGEASGRGTKKHRQKISSLITRTSNLPLKSNTIDICRGRTNVKNNNIHNTALTTPGYTIEPANNSKIVAITIIHSLRDHKPKASNLSLAISKCEP